MSGSEWMSGVESGVVPVVAARAPSRREARVLSGRNIVCFAGEWGALPDRHHHVMRGLARHNKVLWLSAMGARASRLSSLRDLGALAQDIGAAAQGLRQVHDNLWVCTALGLPTPYHRHAVRLNRRILRAQVAALRHALGMTDFQVWSFMPTAADYCGHLGEAMMVYDCAREWSELAGVDREAVRRMDRDLCQRADLVITASRALYEPRRRYNETTVLLCDGVDHAHFARALDDDLAEPPALAGIRRPILGYIGRVRDALDQRLVAFLAAARPDWSIVLIGDLAAGAGRLERLRNVHILGPRPYADLPSYCKAFAVGLMSLAGERGRPDVDVKRPGRGPAVGVREYLSAGVPVVATALDETARHAALCRVARSPDDLVRACADAVRASSPAERRRLSRAMQTETWDRRIEELSARVLAVMRS